MRMRKCGGRGITGPHHQGMSAYSAVRVGKLRLKGPASGALKGKKRRKRKRESQEEVNEEDLRHGGWRRVYAEETARGRVLLLTCTGGYVQALDTGEFRVGEPREDGEGPHAGEVFSLVRVGETDRVAIKTAYGRYVSVAISGDLAGRTEAMGPREQWELVFEEGKVALCACNHRFLTVTDDGRLVAASEKAQEREVMTMWSDLPAAAKKKETGTEESELAERNVASVEYSYVKKFQSWEDRRVRVCGESKEGLEAARQQGRLHEALLDRRERMKADRYCK
ncbi:Protein FRG1 [Geodia barretti]|uniref:Protein FRG1 n=1 Tax=Geodia barretti TaxID=519541 RepID=A0AA35W5T9_GEOBA|nr:Protein FRG1 [Geodia barretti]